MQVLIPSTLPISPCTADAHAMQTNAPLTELAEAHTRGVRTICTVSGRVYSAGDEVVTWYEE